MRKIFQINNYKRSGGFSLSNSYLRNECDIDIIIARM
jgi:hypothetical protein